MARDCPGTGSACCHNARVLSACVTAVHVQKKYILGFNVRNLKKFDNTGSDSDLFSVFYSVGSTFSSIQPQSLVYMLRGWISATLGDDFRIRHEHTPTE